ncbi:hypothetical protein RYZ26_03595 [Terasakiella sp. A23]|uniref:DUF6898 family protein n=1 Tax=Terasakiella sp. FCG-A23 TaxID=3080561 RepID=UPI002952DC33|nr:hypothetical protein [Terasakiella sp. A23]MDV7338666.1 hypothetical protein [Terasakiella sp. A23]
MNQRVKVTQCYFEIRRYGNYLRVSAIDPNSGTEAISTGPVKMGEEVLKRAAHRKLEYILTKKLQKQTEQNRQDWTA